MDGPAARPYICGRDANTESVDLGRLTQAWAQGSGGCSTAPSASTLGGPSPYLEQFAYDATGNRTSEDITYSSTNFVDYPRNTFPAAGSPQPHTLTSQQVVSSAYGYWTDTRGYDAAGDTTSIVTPNSSQALTWNDQGDLSSVVDSVSNHTTTYVYDAGGSLLVRHDDGAAMLYLPGEELAASGSSVTATRSYTHDGATVAVRTPSGVDWMASDPHGTGLVTIDASGQAVTQRLFDPFGNLRWPFPGAWPGDRGFVGGWVDSTTALTDLGAREYDPVTGRFLSADPVLNTGDPQQMNGYAYANNSPVTYADPSGLMFPAGDGGPPSSPPRPSQTPLMAPWSAILAAGAALVRSLVRMGVFAPAPRPAPLWFGGSWGWHPPMAHPVVPRRRLPPPSICELLPAVCLGFVNQLQPNRGQSGIGSIGTCVRLYLGLCVATGIGGGLNLSKRGGGRKDPPLGGGVPPGAIGQGGGRIDPPLDLGGEFPRRPGGLGKAIIYALIMAAAGGYIFCEQTDVCHRPPPPPPPPSPPPPPPGYFCPGAPGCFGQP